MPLTWDTTECKDSDFIRATDEEWSVTYVLIMSTMNVGIGRITEANVAEFYSRVHLLEGIYGNLLIATNKETGELIDRKITPHDVMLRIGLHTNAAFKDESRASFIKRHVTNRLNDGLWDYNRAKERDFTGRGDKHSKPEPVEA